jgi:hypothetical protein
MKDLIVLVPDKNMQSAVDGLLRRNHSFAIRNISFDVTVHSQRDPGIFIAAHEFLRLFLSRYSYAMVMLDREGCGCNETALEIARLIQGRLNTNGWQGRSHVIVLDPELEIWVWSDSPAIAQYLGWDDMELRMWLTAKYSVSVGSNKPDNPKGVFEKALRLKRKPRSSSIYKKLAENVGFERCTDQAFQDFKATLRSWFSVD